MADTASSLDELRRFSESYAAARKLIVDSRQRIEDMEREHKGKATKALERIDAVLNGFDNDILSLHASLATESKSDEVLANASRLAATRLQAALRRGRRLEIAGALEIAVLEIAVLRFRTIIPYFHRDELLDKLWDLGEQYKTLASELKSASDEQGEKLVGRKAGDFLTHLRNLSSKLEVEKKRRLLKSVFWPALALTSFSILVAQVALGSLNLALAGAIIFLMALAFFFAVFLGPSIVAFLKGMNRKGRAIFFAVLTATPTAIAAASWLSETALGRPPSGERIGGLLLVGIAVDGLLTIQASQDARKKFVKAEQNNMVALLSDLS